MRREKAFKQYLQKITTTSTVENYLTYCRKVEDSFGGADMDDIISDYKKISKAKDKLVAHGYPAGYMSGLNAYLKFALSNPQLSPALQTSPTPHASPLYLVSRAEGVPLSADVAAVCTTLEQEYDSIVCFAKKLFRGMDIVKFDYIPIIISDETPKTENPDGAEKILGTFFGSDKPYIEIYYRNANPKDAAAYRKCLAHEYMHYLHYVYAGQKFGAATKDLKEALADFFGVLYSIHRGQKDDVRIAKARYNKWKKYFGSYWPYANALYFYRVKGNEMKFSSDYNEYTTRGCIDKFLLVFAATRNPPYARSLLETH